MPAKPISNLMAYRIENARMMPLAAVRTALPTRWVVLAGKAA